MERNQSYFALPSAAAPAAAPAADPRADVIGIGCVGLAALIFGLAGTCTKWVGVNALFFMAVRSPVEWVLSVATLLVVWRSKDGADLAALRSLSFGAKNDRRGRGVVVARSVTLWATNVLSLLAFTLLPVGDAAAIMYAVGPAFNGLFAFVLLGEPLLLRTWLLFLANVGGTLLIVRPQVLFGDLHAVRLDPAAYWRGVGAAVAATVFSGLRPVLTRAVRPWHWSSISHAGCAWSLFLLTPLSLAALYAADQAAFAAHADGLACVLHNEADCPSPRQPEGVDEDLPSFPRPYAALTLFLTPVLSFTANLLNAYAYRTVTHSHTANMLAYLEIPFAFMLQHFLFGDPVDWLDGVGILVILSSAAGTWCLAAWEARRDRGAEEGEAATGEKDPSTDLDDRTGDLDDGLRAPLIEVEDDANPINL